MPTNQFIEQLSKLFQLSPEFKIALTHFIRRELYHKGQIVQSKDQVVDQLRFVEKGSVLQYYLKEGRKIPHHFWQEGALITNGTRLFTQSPASEYIQVLEDSSLLVIDYEQLLSWRNQFPETDHLIFSLLLNAMEEEKKLFAFQSIAEPKERYRQLQKNTPAIFLKILKNEVSNFLRISTSTYDRIRAVKKSNH